MIRIAPYRNGGWEIDIRGVDAHGRAVRKRIKSPLSSRSRSLEWAKKRERAILLGVPELEEAPRRSSSVPTLKDFSERFLRDYVEANRHKPSGVEAKRSILEHHLIPLFGSLPLDRIGPLAAQQLKTALKRRSAKTVNNALSVLHRILAVAVEWEVISGPAPRMQLLHYERPERPFWEFEDLEKLLAAARSMGWTESTILLLGARAGLRCGELIALSWSDVDLRRRRLTVRASDWRGHLSSTKGRKLRRIPLASDLAAILKDGPRDRAERVLTQGKGLPLTQQNVRTAVAHIERGAGLPALGVHALRHTFCSHLAMRGVPARAIQELAGHENLTTTMGYMHLSPAAIESAIRTLESRVAGDARETER